MNWRPERAALAAAVLLAGCEHLPTCQLPSAELQRQQRYDQLVSENRDLQRELDEARAKIKALTAIERSLEPSAAQPGKVKP